MISRSFLYKRKWVSLVILTIVVYFTHSASIITLTLLLGCFFLIKRPIHYAISIPLYIFITFIYDPSYTTILADFFEEYLSFGIFESYAEHSDRWFGEDAIREQEKTGIIYLITFSLFNFSLFYLGYLALKTKMDQKILSIFNVVTLGYIMLHGTMSLELWHRMTISLQMFYFVPVGYIIYVYFEECRQPGNHYAVQFKKHFPFGMAFILLELLRRWAQFIFFKPDADFFWYHFDDVLLPQELPFF